MDAEEKSILDAGAIRWLTPETTSVFEGTFNLIHCTVKGDTLYRGVFAVRMFPVRYPDRFISLRYTDPDEKDREIGVIEDLKTFPKEQQALLAMSLARHYSEQVIGRIHGVRCRYGLLFFEVETQRGREKFVMPWRGDRTEDYGENGKVLLDAFDNRYIIPNVGALPQTDQRRLTVYIYW